MDLFPNIPSGSPPKMPLYGLPEGRPMPHLPPDRISQMPSSPTPEPYPDSEIHAIDALFQRAGLQRNLRGKPPA